MAENYPQQQSTNDHKPSRKRSPFFWVGVVVVIVVVFIGISLVLAHTLTHKGIVTSISATSITIKPSSAGKSETFTITSQTMEQRAPNKAPTAFEVKDVHDGETVTVATDGPHSKQAGVILLYAQS